jgi:hypothetical protein
MGRHRAKDGYANIGGMSYSDMINEAERGGVMVTMHCAHCLEKRSGGPVTTDGHRMGIKRFGNLRSIEFLEPIDGSPFGMWRCGVQCLSCETTQLGVHFQELATHQPYSETDGPRKWSHPDEEEQPR